MTNSKSNPKHCPRCGDDAANCDPFVGCGWPREDGPAESNGYDTPDDPEIDPTTGEPFTDELAKPTQARSTDAEILIHSNGHEVETPGEVQVAAGPEEVTLSLLPTGYVNDDAVATLSIAAARSIARFILANT